MYFRAVLLPFPCDRQSLCGHWESRVAGPGHPGHSSQPLSITTTLNPPPLLSLVPFFLPRDPGLYNPGHSQTFCGKSPAPSGNRSLIFRLGQLRTTRRRLWAALCPVLCWVAVPAHAHVSSQLLPCRVIEQIISGQQNFLSGCWVGAPRQSCPGCTLGFAVLSHIL